MSTGITIVVNQQPAGASANIQRVEIVGAPDVDASDVGKVLSVTDDSPLTLDWVSQSGGATAGDTTPQAVGTATAGVAATVSRVDHVHAHGNQAAGGSMHAAATTSVAGFMSAADKAALDALGTPRTAVLEFTQTYIGHVRHGQFWLPPPVTLGDFLWEAWIKVANLQTVNGSQVPGYLISDGYGGAHALLWGFSQGAVDAVLMPTGNIWNGSSGQGLAADEGAYPGEWIHYAVSLVNDPAAGSAKQTTVYINGIAVGTSSFTGTRQSKTTVSDGCGDLFVMGSNHDNLTGRLAQLRGFENFCPHTYPRKAFVPETNLGPQAYADDGTFTDCNFLASYQLGGGIIPDLAPIGYNGGSGTAKRHPGAIYSAGPEATGSVTRGIPNASASAFPMPRWVYDDNCPAGAPNRDALTVPTLDVPSLSPCPVGAKLFDSFDRAQQNYAWRSSPTLGSTDSRASLGSLAWTTHGITSSGLSSSVWGIRYGMAIPLSGTLGTTAEVDTGSATQDIRVTRRAGSNGVNSTGICFRFQDRDNFWFAYPISDGAAIRVGAYNAGTYDKPDNGDAVPAFNGYSTAAVPSWERLRVVASGTTITIYVGVDSNVDDANGFPVYTWTQIGQLTSQTHLQSATKAGICGIPYNANDVTSMMRMDNWEAR